LHRLPLSTERVQLFALVHSIDTVRPGTTSPDDDTT
jgi:hypothetical protein